MVLVLLFHFSAESESINKDEGRQEALNNESNMGVCVLDEGASTNGTQDSSEGCHHSRKGV